MQALQQRVKRRGEMARNSPYNQCP